MNCAQCGRENPPENAFCGGCGAALERVCTACARSNPPDHRFCGGCGAPLQAPGAAQSAPAVVPRIPRDYTPKHLAEKILQSKTALEGERKQVTVLFCDIQGSMQLAQELDPEHWHHLLERYFEILTAAVHRYEGTVNQYTGDGIMALFGAPIAHEDHAQRACYAALQARDALREFGDRLRLSEGLNFSFRIGLNSGEVVVGKIGDDLRMDYTAQGATVGIAQRIEQLAAPGCVYLGGTTERLVRGYFRLRAMGETSLKGLAQAVALFELEAPGQVRSRLDVSIARGLSRFVGRAAEMQVLETALANAERGHGQVVGIVGEAGLGKSRLCYEFVENCRRRGLPVYEAHCPAHGRNIPYLPVLELFRDYFGIRADDDAAQARKKIAGTLALLDNRLQEALPVLLEFVGVADPQHPAPRMDAEARQRQLYELVHRIVEAQDAQGQLAVTLVDDLHWIDPGSDAFIGQLVAAAAGRRSLVVLNFRPEYQAAFAGKAHYQQLPLVPLGADALGELLGDLLGDDTSLAELVPRIVRWTAGNPFYTEEVVNALVEAGDLAGQPGHYRLVRAIDDIVVPTSVRAVLAARIDRLPETAKRLLQTAAVIGREFSGPLLETVSDLDASEHAAASERLKAGDFVYERALYPVFEYAFKHPLTHEVAYRSLLQARREQVHAAVARAIEANAGDKLDEQAALVAHHYEQAGEILTAARWHRRAAEWAETSDLKAAQQHWLRVADLARQCTESDETQALVSLACGRALVIGVRIGLGDAVPDAVYAQGIASAERCGDARSVLLLKIAFGCMMGNAGRGYLDYIRYADEAVRVADAIGDPALRAGTRVGKIYSHLYCGKLHEAVSAAAEIIEIVGGDPDLGSEVLALSPLYSARGVQTLATGRLRDPRAALAVLADERPRAEAAGHPEMALWLAGYEVELKLALEESKGLENLARLQAAWAENQGMLSRVNAAVCQCDLQASNRAWSIVLRIVDETLNEIELSGVGELFRPRLLALRGGAQLAMGNPKAARSAALEGVAFMRDTHSAWNLRSYAVLARAQLALDEPGAAVAATLDEYAGVLERTGFAIYEGESQELRAALAERDGDQAARSTALEQALACYTRFGMDAQAHRVEQELRRGRV
ncbi:MAG: AAA family ATPase [Gammaproteobacteria bacterium]|nr:AAA family ATPase [Gammaproteobacteria bacterium]